MCEIKLDYKNGLAVYEVEFDTAEFEYDYEIDAVSGAVVKSKKEANDDKHQSTPSAPSTTPNTTPSTNSNSTITASRAKEIAPEHAKLTGKNVSFIKVEKDFDDGTEQYEIEFYFGGYEYEYEINAKTGAIISHEKERD